ncbi:MBL fold metallo-hydrolase [Pseudonocardia bannensis]|uniref:MBL fold metallo-hydrolase n=1 Tax=Pseudonocardia bannensis TaxID=630973 RepID=A0A848DED3_9PSEU|nr:MBL fold metallo-hydrolase [Pseudonocardia bannensis]NMH90944.1 MBL fold metallo-hydrolase [Pseudonocardia bannensis]
MCEGGGTPAEVAAAIPRPATAPAVDPIALEPVDEVVVTTLMDNSYDALMGDTGLARRAPFSRLAQVPAPQFEEGRTFPGLVAEHGFSALVTTRRGTTSHTVLFDTGVSPDGMAVNIERLGLDVGVIEVVVLSHGHVDHDGGFPGLARLRGRSGLPLTVHPLVWSRRRFVLSDQPPWELPTLSRSALEAEGLQVIERRQPSLLLDDSVLITGEVDRTTEFERGLPNHEAWRDGRWEPDPLILDEQALVVHVRGRGLVVLTGCGHAGAVNIARHAMRLTGVDRLHALLGGFHLTGPAFEPVIEPTVAAFAEMAPDVLVPAHCTGWKAQHRLAATLPTAFVPNAVGTSFTLAGSGP